MPDFYHSSYEARLDPRVTAVNSNAPIGFPRVEQVVALTANKISLHGPPIEINHPEEYHSLDYRCNNGGETLKYGIAGIYNIDGSSWITGKITDVDEFGTTITLYDAGSPTVEWVSKGETCMVYYYARVAYNGGMKITPIQGDEWTPEVSDILVRKCNDSMPSRFGSMTGGSGNTFKWSPDMMYHTATVNTGGGFITVLDYSGTGTFRQSTWPVYTTEISVRFDEPVSWPYFISVRITIDGEEVIREYGDSTDSRMTYADFDSAQYLESGGPYTWTPGSVKCSSADWQMFFDLYRDVDDKVVMRVPIKAEILSDIKVEMYPSAENIGDVDCYVAGYYID